MTLSVDFFLFKNTWDNCKMCQIGSLAYNHVFGQGPAPAKFLFVGEGPGVSEDTLGQPFVGRSGRLLREALGAAGFKENELYITNLVACRPCNEQMGPNRAPTRDEVLNCEQRLRGIVGFVKPKTLVAVGSVAENWLQDFFSGTHHIKKIKHPAYILRQGGKDTEEFDFWFKSIKELRNGKI